MRTFARSALMGFGLLWTAVSASAANGNVTPSALMVSDTHFNPFHDPAKVKQLKATPASGWETIFASGDSPTQAQDFEELRTACKLRGIDTPYSLFCVRDKCDSSRRSWGKLHHH
jgi:sphingomyelin phosphodiesterase acid-like 3